jgi:hypothetical protein
MFSVTPYQAEFQKYVTQPDGGLKSEWHQCRVLGITKDADGEPVYVVQVGDRGETHLQLEHFVRHPS